MGKIVSLKNVSWEKIEEIVKDKNFLDDIESISNEELKDRFKKFDVDASDEEVDVFRKKVIKIIDANSETETTRKLNRQLLSQEELEQIIGGGVVRDGVIFVAGAIAACLVMGIKLVVLKDAVQDKMGKAKGMMDKWL